MVAGDKKYTFHLKRLYCYIVEEHKFDDVYLKYEKKKIWPLGKKQQPVYMDSKTELDICITGLKDGQRIQIKL